MFQSDPTSTSSCNLRVESIVVVHFVKTKGVKSQCTVYSYSNVTYLKDSGFY